MKYKGKEVSKPYHYIYTILDDKYIYIYETNYLSKHIYDNVLKKNIDKNNIQNIYQIDELYTYTYIDTDPDTDTDISIDSFIDDTEDKTILKKRKRNEKKKHIKKKILDKLVIDKIKIELEDKIKYTFSKREKRISVDLKELKEEKKELIKNIMNKLEKEKFYKDSGNTIFTKYNDSYKNKMILRAEKRFENNKKDIKEVKYVVNKYVDYDTDEIKKNSGYGSDGYSISDYDSNTKIKYWWSLTGIYNSREEHYY